MNGAPLLDTHFWIWWLLGDPALKPSERDALDGFAPDERPYLSDISLWETALLVERGRLALDRSLDEFLEVAASPATVRVLPISREIVVEMNRLPPGFHRDPADRLIVATARALGLRVATRDDRIRGSRLARVWSPRS